MSRALVVVACDRESAGIIAKTNAQPDELLNSFILPEYREKKIGLYILPAPFTFDILVCGVLGHNAASTLAALFLQYSGKYKILINFGSCGSYSPELVGQVCFVDVAEGYGVSDNTHWTVPVPLYPVTILSDAPEFKHHVVSCASGNAYSSASERNLAYFPKSVCIEDFELYSIACLCRTLRQDLCAIKYVANVASGINGASDQTAREQLRDNIITYRERAERVLLQYLMEQGYSPVHL